MAHKKFIDNPLGVRLSKKESLLIPLQKQKAGGLARFLCDLCDSSSKGYPGKALSPPLQASGSASLPARAAILAGLDVSFQACPSCVPWKSAFGLDCSGVSITMQGPDSARSAKEKRKKYVIFPSHTALFSVHLTPLCQSSAPPLSILEEEDPEK